MKRWIALLLAAMMLFALAACNENKADSKGSASDSTTSAHDDKDSSSIDKNDGYDDSSSDKDSDDKDSDDKDSDDKDSDDKDSDDKDSNGNNSSNGSSSGSKSDSSKKYDTMQDYLNDTENSKGIEDIKKNAQDTMDIDIKAEGNTIVYEYTYKTVVDDDSLETVRASLEQVLDSNESSFESIAQSMQAEIADSIKLKVVYRDQNGTLIAERTFSP